MDDRRVLVADDDPANLRMLCALVRSWGYTPVPAETGGEALEALTSSSSAPRVAILDWMMPGATGPEICRAVRARPGGHEAFLILLTARTGPADAVEALDSGADDHLGKPFDFAELRARLARADRRPAQRIEEEQLGPGSLLAGRWELVSRIGAGGMGEVWRGRHASLGHGVAIKLIRPDLESQPALRARFESEARYASQVRSQHSVPVFDYGTTPGGQPYLVMEHLVGEPLSTRLLRDGPMPLSEVASLVEQVARGLSAAHELGIVHRDIKPENVFLVALGAEPTGGPYIAKILDFGVAKAIGAPDSRPALTADGQTVGTLGFSSPEQLVSGGVGVPADIWSLGALAYAAATGRGPYAGEPEGSVLVRICHGAIPTPSETRSSLPRAFDEWFAKACAMEPGERFASALAAASALSEIAATSSEVPSAPEPARASPPPRAVSTAPNKAIVRRRARARLERALAWMATAFAIASAALALVSRFR